jgi:hypothetical protein
MLCRQATPPDGELRFSPKYEELTDKCRLFLAFLEDLSYNVFPESFRKASGDEIWDIIESIPEEVVARLDLIAYCRLRAATEGRGSGADGPPAPNGRLILGGLDSPDDLDSEAAEEVLRELRADYEILRNSVKTIADSTVREAWVLQRLRDHSNEAAIFGALLVIACGRTGTSLASLHEFPAIVNCRHWAIRAMALRNMQMLGAPASAECAVRQAASDEHPVVRARAVRWLSEAPAASTDVFRVLATCLRDWACREYAIEGLVAMDLAGGVKLALLQSALHDDCVTVLKMLEREPEAEEWSGKSLPWETLGAARVVIDGSRRDGLIEEIGRDLRDPGSTHVLALHAVECLGVGASDVAEDLAGLLHSEFWYQRRGAAEALHGIGSLSRELEARLVAAAGREAHAGVRAKIVKCLVARFGESGSDAVGHVLREAAIDFAWEVRVAAVVGATQVARWDAAAVEILKRALSDEESCVRVEAVKGHSCLGSEATSVLPEIRKLLVSSSQEERLRAATAVVGIEGRIDDEVCAALVSVIEMVRPSSRKTRASFSIGRGGTEEGPKRHPLMRAQERPELLRQGQDQKDVGHVERRSR